MINIIIINHVSLYENNEQDHCHHPGFDHYSAPKGAGHAMDEAPNHSGFTRLLQLLPTSRACIAIVVIGDLITILPLKRQPALWMGYPTTPDSLLRLSLHHVLVLQLL